MSCISSNFSSFFLNSLNDTSEFTKYLSNGELKCSSFEEFQVFGTGTQAQQQPPPQLQYASQQQLLSGTNGNMNSGVIGGATITADGGQSGVTPAASIDMFNGGTHVEINNYNATAQGAATQLQQHQAALLVQHHPSHHQHHPHPHHAHPHPHPHPHTQPLHSHPQHHATPPHLIHHQTQLFNHQHPHPHQHQHQPAPGSSFHHNHLAAAAAAAAAAVHHTHSHSSSSSSTTTTGNNNNGGGVNSSASNISSSSNNNNSSHPTTPSAIPPQGYTPSHQRWPTAAAIAGATHHSQLHGSHPNIHAGAQHFDGSFEFLKYLRHSNDFNDSNAADASAMQTASPATPAPSIAATVAPVSVTALTNAPASNAIVANPHQHQPHQRQHQHPHPHPHPHQQHQSQQQQQQQQASTSCLIDLDSSTTHKSPRSSRKVAALLSSVSRASNSLDSTLDVFDHDSKHTIFDLHHMTSSSNSNESSMEISNLAFPNSHLNASNSNTSSEGAAAGSTDFPMLNSTNSSAPKPLASFAIKDNFDVHPSHKVEEGIFQHMNKLPSKKKENLKQLGVRFTGQMTLADKSIVVENFIKFCQEYDIKDHRPFLSLNQSGLNKPEQIKFARYLGQGLPTFTLFCIYSNFKNLFCTKRTEIYTKDGYNLPYILDKTKRFLSNTTAGNLPNKHVQGNAATAAVTAAAVSIVTAVPAAAAIATATACPNMPHALTPTPTPTPTHTQTPTNINATQLAAAAAVPPNAALPAPTNAMQTAAMPMQMPAPPVPMSMSMPMPMTLGATH